MKSGTIVINVLYQIAEQELYKQLNDACFLKNVFIYLFERERVQSGESQREREREREREKIPSSPH